MNAPTRLGTFDRRLVGGLVAVAAVALLASLLAVLATGQLLRRSDESGAAVRFRDALRLQSAAGRKLYVAPVYLLSGDPYYHVDYESARRSVRNEIQARLQEETDPAGRALLRRARDAQDRHDAALERAFLVPRPQAAAFYLREVAPLRARFAGAVDEYARFSAAALSRADALSERIARTRRWILGVAVTAMVLLAAMMWALRGSLLRLYAAEAGQRAASVAARQASETLARARAEAHETTRLILESALDAVITTDPNGVVTAWNRQAERIFGWPEREIVGRRLAETLLAPEDRHLVRAALEDSGAGPIRGQLELTGVRRDGGTFPVEVALVPVRRAGIGLSVFARDIGERRRIVSRLRAGEEEFRAAFESSGIGHAQVDIPSGRVRRVNPKLCEIAGATPEELIGTPFASLLEESGEGWLERLLRDGEQAVDDRLRRRDGGAVAVHVTVTLIRDADGAPRRALAVVQDLSELRRAQSALQATEERFQAMADSAPVLIWMSGTDGRTTWVNRPWREFRGTDLPAEIAAGWESGIHPDDRARHAAAAGTASEARVPFTAEFRLRRADGEWRWMLSQGVPLRGPSGAFGGYIGSCVDISERKRQEEQRESLLASERFARAEAERSGRIKDEFLATLSHELRTPLQAMLGWSRLLATGRLDAGQSRHGLEVIERNVTLQKRLIEDLLDMSRIVQGKMRLESRPVDLGLVVDAAIEVVRPAAEAKMTRIVLQRDPRVGPVLGDAQRLQQAVWNLLSNAIKFTPAGGRVDVRIEREGDEARIEVQDSGEGIAPDFLPHVFERFRQEDASITRAHRGLGLGLAIVRHLVELHGGRVSASSDGPGRGATFTILLPVAHGWPAAAPAATAEVRPPVRDRDRLSGLRLLVVDDEEDARELMTRVLCESGAEVRAARSAGEALDLERLFHPDVIVSDIGMPGRDGYDLIRSLREREGAGAHVPAIALTAFARTEDAQRAIEAGFQRHLAKPVEPAELEAAVRGLAAGVQESTRPA